MKKKSKLQKNKTDGYSRFKQKKEPLQERLFILKQKLTE